MASPPTTGGRPRKSVRFNDEANTSSPNPYQRHDRSPSTASDDTDETIRPERPPPYTQYGIPYSSSGSSDFGPSQSTTSSVEDLGYVTNSPSLSTPLLSRQSPSPSSVVDGIESQPRQAKQSVEYGTMTAPPTRRRTSQQTQYPTPSHPSEQVESEGYFRWLWRSLWGWLRGVNITSQPEHESESITSEEIYQSLELDQSSGVGRSKKLIQHISGLASKLHGLGRPADQLTTTNVLIQTAMSLSFMLVLAVVVFAIGYRVNKLAMMVQNDR